MLERVTSLYGVRPTIEFVEIAALGNREDAAVTSPIDPFDPIGTVGRLWTRGTRDAKSWLDQWVDATAAWASAPPR